MSTAHIYGLIDPRNGQIRYIGKSKNPIVRRYLHVCASQTKAKSHRNHWIRQLVAEGLVPELTILESVDATEWQEAERWWIAYMKFIGANLTNGTAGGDGLHDPSPEVRERCGAFRRGKKFVFTAEHKAKIAAANRKRSRDPVWQARMTAILRKHHKATGHPWLPASRAKASVSAKRRFANMTTQERRDFAMRGVAARLAKCNT